MQWTPPAAGWLSVRLWHRLIARSRSASRTIWCKEWLMKHARHGFARSAALIWVLLAGFGRPAIATTAAPPLAPPMPPAPLTSPGGAAGLDAAAGPPLLLAAGPGQLVQAPDLASRAELVRFDADLVRVLLALPQGSRVRLADWPVAPGERRDVVLARHEVYAPGARIFKVEGGSVTEVPRSPLVFFWGTHAGDPLSELSVAVDPRTHTLESLSRSAAGTFELRPLAPGKPGLHLVAEADAFLGGAAGGHRPDWTCAQDEVPPQQAPREPNLLPGLTPTAPQGPGSGLAAAASPAVAAESIAAGGASALRTATVAIDTDSQLLAGKFGNDTNAATSYLASLFAAINP